MGGREPRVVLIASSPRCKDIQEAFNVLFAHFLGVCGVVPHSVCAADTQYTAWVRYKGRGFYSAHKLRATNDKQHGQASGEAFPGCIIPWSLRAGREEHMCR